MSQYEWVQNPHRQSALRLLQEHFGEIVFLVPGSHDNVTIKTQ